MLEYDEAIRLYKKKLFGADPLFRLRPPLPSAGLSHCDEETWYLRDQDGRLLARVSREGVHLR